MTKPTLESLQAEIETLRQDKSSDRLAVTYWMMQLFVLHAGGRPDRMAIWIRTRMEALKQLSPPDTGEISPADYDEGLMRMMPGICAVGEMLAADLEDVARGLRAGEYNVPSIHRG